MRIIQQYFEPKIGRKIRYSAWGGSEKQHSYKKKECVWRDLFLTFATFVFSENWFEKGLMCNQLISEERLE